MSQEGLFDFAPDEAEEIVRLKRLAQDRKDAMEAILADPIIKQYQVAAKALDKKVSELNKLRTQNAEFEAKIKELEIPTLDEPSEDGFYIFTKRESSRWGRKPTVSVSRYLYFKAMGEWFDLKEGNSTVSEGYGNQSCSFEELLNLDGHVLEVSIEKLEDSSTYPHALLKNFEEARGPRDIAAEIAGLHAELDGEDEE